MTRGSSSWKDSCGTFFWGVISSNCTSFYSTTTGSWTEIWSWWTTYSIVSWWCTWIGSSWWCTWIGSSWWCTYIGSSLWCTWIGSSLWWIWGSWWISYTAIWTSDAIYELPPISGSASWAVVCNTVSYFKWTTGTSSTVLSIIVSGCKTGSALSVLSGCSRLCLGGAGLLQRAPIYNEYYYFTIDNLHL